MAYEGSRSAAPRRRYGRRKVCRFCADKKATIITRMSAHCVISFQSVARLRLAGFQVPVQTINVS